MKKNMLEVIKRIEEPECFLIVTNNAIRAQARGDELLAMIACVMEEVKNTVPRETYEQMLDEVYGKEKNKKDDLSKIKEIIKMIEELD